MRFYSFYRVFGALGLPSSTGLPETGDQVWHRQRHERPVLGVRDWSRERGFRWVRAIVTSLFAADRHHRSQVKSSTPKFPKICEVWTALKTLRLSLLSELTWMTEAKNPRNADALEKAGIRDGPTDLVSPGFLACWLAGSFCCGSFCWNV